MDHNKYMTTGEFARRMGVTKNTLFHYDNIGLFLPEIVDIQRLPAIIPFTRWKYLTQLSF